MNQEMARLTIQRQRVLPRQRNASDRRSNETTPRFGVPRPLVWAPVIVAALVPDDDLSRS